MDEALLTIYRQARYRVRLPGGRAVRLLVEQPLPRELNHFVEAQPWSLVTAWNPHSQPVDALDNRHAQRRLLADLRQNASLIGLLAAMASGVDGWREPSLFAIGIPLAVIDALVSKYEQNAYLCGQGAQPVALRWVG